MLSQSSPISYLDVSTCTIIFDWNLQMTSVCESGRVCILNLFHALSLALFFPSLPSRSQYHIHNLSHLRLATVSNIVTGECVTRVSCVFMGIRFAQHSKEAQRGISSSLFWCHYIYRCCKTRGFVFRLLSQTEIQALFKCSAFSFEWLQKPFYLCRH